MVAVWLVPLISTLQNPMSSLTETFQRMYVLFSDSVPFAAVGEMKSTSGGVVSEVNHIVSLRPMLPEESLQ